MHRGPLLFFLRQKQVIEQIWFLLLGGLAIAYGLDVWAGHDFPMVLALAIGGSFISYIYSAPPIKLKQNGWLGNYALGSSYISLPWWCGQAMFGELNIQASCVHVSAESHGLIVVFCWCLDTLGLGALFLRKKAVPRFQSLLRALRKRWCFYCGRVLPARRVASCATGVVRS